MTSSSSPGISLMMEGLSYIAGTEVPMVLVDVMRGGPGLGNIAPAQADYNQIVHGGTHGDFHPIVLAPASVQEAVDLTGLAFELAEKYRNVAVVLTDGALGQMMKPTAAPICPLPTTSPTGRYRGQPGASGATSPPLTWINRQGECQPALGRPLGDNLRPRSSVQGLLPGRGAFPRRRLWFRRADRPHRGPRCPRRRHPGRAAAPDQPGALPLLGAGRAGRQLDGLLVVEINAGQMLEDVRLAMAGQPPVEFFGGLGGVVPFPDEVLAEIDWLVAGPRSTAGHPRACWLERRIVVP